MPTLTAFRLTRAQADGIVAAVKADPICKERIGSSFWSYLPPGFKLAGSMRNLTMMMKSGALLDPRPLLGLPQPPMDEEDAAVVCYGIALATVNAIIKAKVPGVAGAETCDRNLGGTAHVATRVNMSKMGAVVFDWHATLRLGDPIIYRTLPDWQKDLEGQVYSTFKGC